MNKALKPPCVWNLGWPYPPSLNQEVLLEEITARPLAKTLEVGLYLFVGNFRIRKPALGFQ